MSSVPKKERRNRQELIEVLKICKGISTIKPEELFHFDDRGKGTRGHSLKLVKVRCTRDSRRLFSNRVITRWNQLDQGAVDAASINAFNSKLEGLRHTRMGFFMDQLNLFTYFLTEKITTVSNEYS